MVSVLAFRSSGPSLSLDQGHCVVMCSQARQFILIVSLSSPRHIE